MNDTIPESNSQNQNTPIPLTNPELIEPPTNNKSLKKPVIIFVALLLCILAVAALFIVLAKKYTSKSKQTNETVQNSVTKSSVPELVKQVLVNPADGKKINIDITNEFYTVSVGQTDYYGHAVKLNDDFLELSPTAYKKSGKLIFSGDELHGPYQITYFKISQITKFQRLGGASNVEAPIVQFLMTHKSDSLRGDDALPSKIINDYVKKDEYQAYFFKDGSAFFAKTTGLDGSFLANVGHVYFLRTVPQTNPNGATINDISLSLAKSEQYDKLSSSDILYWQNMKPDSQITKAITQFQKQNP